MKQKNVHILDAFYILQLCLQKNGNDPFNNNWFYPVDKKTLKKSSCANEQNHQEITPQYSALYSP